MVTEWDGLRWTQPPPGADAVIGKTISVVGVSCTSARACTAVGFDGQVFEWNGAHAASQDLGNVVSDFRGVSCTSRTACVAVGSGNSPGSDGVVVRRS